MQMGFIKRSLQILSQVYLRQDFIREKDSRRNKCNFGITCSESHYTTSESIIHIIFYIRGHQPGAIVLPMGRFAMCGDAFGHHSLSGIRVGGRQRWDWLRVGRGPGMLLASYSTGQTPPQSIIWSKNVINSVKMEKFCSTRIFSLKLCIKATKSNTVLWIA